MGEKPISFRDKDGNFVSAADVWNAEKLEELFPLFAGPGKDQPYKLSGRTNNNQLKIFMERFMV